MSTTIKSRRVTWKEAVWQNHFFASVNWLLPNEYRIDPEYPTETSNENISGSVDYRIVGPKFKGSVEWLITEYGDKSTSAPPTVQDYIKEHYYRFVADPNGKYPQKYKGIADDHFIVINVSHKRSNVKIPGLKPITYFELIVDDELKNVKLYFDNEEIDIVMGNPFIYDINTKQKMKPKIDIKSIQTSEENELSDLLASKGLSELQPSLKEVGVTNIKLLHYLKEDDFEVKVVQKRALFELITQLKEKEDFGSAKKTKILP